MATKTAPRPASTSRPSSARKAPVPMTLKAAARVQSATAHKTGGGVSKDSFAAKAQSSAANNRNTEVTGAKAAHSASRVLTKPSAPISQKSAAGSALSQARAPQKVTSINVARVASKVLSNAKSPQPAKTAAGSALTQRPSKKR